MEKYYMIYHPHNESKLYVVSNTDEYIEDRLMEDEDGNILEFEDDIEAVKWLLDNVKENYIPDEYLSQYSIKYNRKKFLK